MRVYRVSAASNDYDSLVELDEQSRLSGLQPGSPLPPGWQPGRLAWYRGRRKVAADFWSYDHGAAYAVSPRVSNALDNASWCQLVPISTIPQNPRGEPMTPLEMTLLHLVQVVDAVDRTATGFLPLGSDLLDWDTPGAVVFKPEFVPLEGLFLQPDGDWREVLCGEGRGESFRMVAERSGWTGLTFKLCYDASVGRTVK